jgi:hypothetical protein
MKILLCTSTSAQRAKWLRMCERFATWKLTKYINSLVLHVYRRGSGSGGDVGGKAAAKKKNNIKSKAHVI